MMSTADEKNQELSNQPKETKDNLDDLSNKLRRLEDEYHSDKKFVKWGGGLVALVTIAFLGVTVLNIPTKVTEVLDSIVGKETIKVIQEYKAQIEIQATQIAQYATSAENDVNEVKKVTENLPNNALLNFTSCGERYSCTPRACLAKCMELGTRMATYDEVYSWASSGNDHCSIMWMLDSKQSDDIPPGKWTTS